jgi:hypothetical protein
MRIGFMNGVMRVASCLVLGLVLLALPAAAGEVTSSVDLKLWGRAIFNTHYDTAILSQDFMSYITDDSQEQWSFNPRDTRLGFSAGQTHGDWAYRAVFEMDFYGSNASNNLLPRMRLGFVEAKNDQGLTIRGGQDWVPVAQQNPGTIDFGVQSWSGNLWWRVPQLTLRYKPKNLEFLVSAMKHRVSNAQEQQEKMPWILGRVGASDLLGEGSLLAIGGGFRSVTVSENDYSPYMAAVELKMPFGESGIALNGEFYVGQGVGREYVHYGFDYNASHPDGATEIQSQGGFASLKVPANPKIEFNAGYGFDDPKDEDMEGADAAYLKNQSMFLNFKHKITKQFGWGLEVIHFITTVGDEEAEAADATKDLTGERFTTSMWFVF